MARPLVIAYHPAWTAHTWWLPNDPRGSGSTAIRTDPLAELGELRFGRKKIQPPGREIRTFYQEAADLLKHPLLVFVEASRIIIADAFGQAIHQHAYTCYACAIMPDHVHVLIRKHKHDAEAMVENLIKASRASLIQAGHRAARHPTWIAGSWTVFLDHPDEIRRTIRYIEQNPDKDGLPAQVWPFVKPYDGWPLHPGHSPNSPYVSALRTAGRYP